MLDPTRPAGDAIVLFDYPVSPCARRVRITLHEKGLGFERRMVDLTRMEQKRPEYLALNPAGVVPTLLHRDRVVCESNVITAYLDEAFPAIRLYPDDPGEREEVERWQRFEADLQPVHRPLAYQRLLGPVLRSTVSLDEALDRVARATDDPAQRDWERRVWELDVLDEDGERRCAGELLRRLELLETGLEGREYLVGDRFTQADLSVFPRVRMFPYVGLAIDGERFPSVARWMDRLERRPSIRATRSWMERAIQLGERRGLLGWLRRVAGAPRSELAPRDRAGLRVARTALRLDPIRAELFATRLGPSRRGAS